MRNSRSAWSRKGNGAVVLALILSASSAAAQESRPLLNTYAMPGLVEMPSAESMMRDDLAYSFTIFQNTIRHSASFQVNNRLTFGIRYNLSYFSDADGGSFGSEDNFDRSFAMHYRFVDEGRFIPSIAVGINDIVGTGRFESEYLVATKSFSDRFMVSAGLGWGRLAGVNPFENPLAGIFPSFAERENEFTTAGDIGDIEWFHGDASFFGGAVWRVTDRLTFAAELSSDRYTLEDGNAFTYRSPYNVGMTYNLTESSSFGLAWLYGSELAFRFSYQFNPGNPPYPSGLESAPPPIQPRAAGYAAAASWNMQPVDLARMRQITATGLEQQNITLHGLTISGTTARVEIVNNDWHTFAQAVGRTSRVLTQTLAPEIDQFDIVLIESGLPVSSTSIRRDDLAAYEFALDGAWEIQTRSVRTDAGPGTQPLDGLYPRLSWDIVPYISTSLFDPDDPIRADAGFDLSGAWEPAPGLIFSGIIRQPLIGNMDESTRVSDSVLPHVRSDAWLYDKANTRVSRLTAASYFRPAHNAYGRVTAGLLEPMFGGVSAELLWYPTDARFAVGAEVAYVVQRDYDQLFEFLDYDVATGHVSGYWDMGNGFQTQLDLGRYLAGDWGGTLTVQRVFENGWELGLFATVTDVPFDDFGEGAFDKGVIISIPVGVTIGQPTRDVSSFVLRPVLRDGGARLNVDGRLYDTVRDATGAELSDGWGRFWR